VLLTVFLPTSVQLSAANKVWLLQDRPNYNSTKWTPTLNVTNDSFTGSFELIDGTKKRPVSFSGVLRQTSSAQDIVIGNGHYLMPELPDPSSVSIRKLSGEVLFLRS